MPEASTRFIIASVALLLLLLLIHVLWNPNRAEGGAPSGTANTGSAVNETHQDSHPLTYLPFTSTYRESPALVPLAHNTGTGNERYLVVRNYNPESGFFWAIYNVLCASHTARTHGLTLVVWFDSGLYLETNRKYMRQYRDYVNPNANSWFHYYFYPLAEGRPEILRQVLNGELFHNMVSFKDWDERQHDPRVRAFEFDRAAYEVRDMNVDYAKEWKACIKLRPHMQEKVNRFYRERMEGKFVVAIHCRGTDKMGNADDSEDGPKHLEYETYCNMVRAAVGKYQHNHRGKSTAILTCSDEQPFIDYAAKRLGQEYEVISCDVIRSNTNTSGLDLKSHECHHNTNTPNCRRYRELAQESIHRGFKHLSNYKKGEDIVFEVLLMSKCNVFLRSRGNASNGVTYAAPQMPVIDMVDASSS